MHLLVHLAAFTKATKQKATAFVLASVTTIIFHHATHLIALFYLSGCLTRRRHLVALHDCAEMLRILDAIRLYTNCWLLKGRVICRLPVIAAR